MGRLVYFLPVRGHLGGAELMASFAAQNANAGESAGEKAGENAKETTAMTAKTAADVEDQNAAMAAVVVILTYADIDIRAARAFLDALPACGGGVFAVVAQVPEGAPFLPKLRERANELQNIKNPVAVMEIPAAAERRQYDETADELQKMLFADNENNGDNITADDKTAPAANVANAANAAPAEVAAGAGGQTPTDAVRAAHLAVRDLL